MDGLNRRTARLLIAFVIAGVSGGVAAVVMLGVFAASGGDPLWLHVAQWINRVLYFIAAVVVVIAARIWWQARHGKRDATTSGTPGHPAPRHKQQ